jgi:Tol biopolymer transport system component/C-terminal processing protease CtpA/Prc
MKRTLWTLGAVCALAGTGGAQDAATAMWIRYPAISPDGTQICFEWRGDLWIVPSIGGDARQLTIHEAFDRSPVWSRDGKTIAFASDRFGNFDVFTVASKGGPATRLTFHSSADFPSAFAPDGASVVFASTRLDAPDSILPTTSLPELYSVPLAGGRPKQLLTTPAELAVFSRDGKLVAYHDRKGYENYWRKHHRSSVTRDVWIWDVASGAHRRLTTSPAEDRNPVLSGDGKSVAYLSEESGAANVWRRAVDGSGEAVQATKFETHPVRFLSTSDADVLAFSWNGELYTMAPGGAPARVAVNAVSDEHENAVRLETFRDGATAFAVSPDEQEVAFIVRGEVFVASTEHGTTKRVTRTSEQERSLAWAPDGRSVYYSAERGASWGVWKTSIARAEESNFFNATKLTEEPVIVGEDEVFQPALSPDGKKLAFLRDRDALCVIDLATKATKVVVPAERNYSYADGDIQYEWSPDSKWLAFTYVPKKRWSGDVGVVDVESGKIVDLTESGYEESNPHWSADGRALLFVSDRLGRRAHGSWGSDGDVFTQFLTQDAFDRASLTREEYDLLKKKEDEKKDEEEKKAGEAKKDEKDKKDAAKEKPPAPVAIEFERMERRVKRATITSAPVGEFAVSKDGENVVYFAKIGDTWDLWLTRPRDHKTVQALELGDDQPGEVVFGKEGKNVFVRRSGGAVVKADVGSLLDPKNDGGGGAKPKPVAYAAEMTIDRPAERAYMFEHAWRQVRRKFYDAKLHGVDWDAMKANYARFLPQISNNYDFTELLSEMLGELNASHTGSGYRPRNPDGDKTAELGLLFDPAHAGDGLRVAEVIVGGPCAKAGSKIAPGVIVAAIDGAALPPSVDPASLLNRKEGKPVLLDLRSPDGATSWQEVVKPTSVEAENDLLYERWLDRCRAIVAKASNGRAGYIHVRGMNEPSFRKTFSEALGRFSDVEALVIDTRFNGGGNLHDDLCSFLAGRDYLSFVPRGKTPGEFGAEPWARWSRPCAVLMGEGNYSDAHIFPYAFKALGLGKLVGAPVAGTGTAVWWESLIDPTVYFGIPQVGFLTPEGKFLENLELDPDVLVYCAPEDVAAGKDAQLLAAVETALSSKRPR